MPSTMLDVFRAQLYSTYCWFKNNKWFMVSYFIWPYLMVLILLGLGSIMGSVDIYAERMKVANPAFFLFSASAIALMSVAIVDATAGFALHNRWIGTLNYIVLSPIRLSKLFVAAGLPESLLSAVFSVMAVAPAAIYFEGLVGGLKLLLVLLVMIAGMLPLVGLAVLAGSLLLILKEESNIISSLNPLILLLSGVFYPITVLPEFMQFMSTFMPTKYVVDAAKMAATYRTLPGSLLILIFGFLAALTLAYNSAAILAIGRAEELVKRRGVE